MAYASSSQIYLTVTKLALSSGDVDMVRSGAVLFSTLIEAEVDGIVENKLFARALVDLVGRPKQPIRDLVAGKLVELLFAVANNIRMQPSILPAWFHPRSSTTATPAKSATTADGGGNARTRGGSSGKVFAGATRTDDFPLFYLLIDYVTAEGRAGDFARTGLLCIIDTASRSENLERWLVESDLASIMATGLGGLYSQLGR